jgi:hypothetical protein
VRSYLNPDDQAAFRRVLALAVRTYKPYRHNEAYWQDEARGRDVFRVYVNGRIDGSAYVGQTGRSPSTRLLEHRLRDPVYHAGTLCICTVPTRGHALGLEAHICRHLRLAGFDATMTHGRSAAA